MKPPPASLVAGCCSGGSGISHTQLGPHPARSFLIFWLQQNLGVGTSISLCPSLLPNLSPAPIHHPVSPGILEYLRRYLHFFWNRVFPLDLPIPDLPGALSGVCTPTPNPMKKCLMVGGLVLPSLPGPWAPTAASQAGRQKWIRRPRKNKGRASADIYLY